MSPECIIALWLSNSFLNVSNMSRALVLTFIGWLKTSFFEELDWDMGNARHFPVHVGNVVVLLPWTHSTKLWLLCFVWLEYTKTNKISLCLFSVVGFTQKALSTIQQLQLQANRKSANFVCIGLQAKWRYEVVDSIHNLNFIFRARCNHRLDVSWTFLL